MHKHAPLPLHLHHLTQSKDLTGTVRPNPIDFAVPSIPIFWLSESCRG